MPAVPPLLAAKLLSRRKCNHISCLLTPALRHEILAEAFIMPSWVHLHTAWLPGSHLAPALLELPICLISQSQVYNCDVTG